MDKQQREKLLSNLGVNSASDGIHITYSDEKERQALGDALINGGNQPVSFGTGPTRVFIEPQSSRREQRQ